MTLPPEWQNETPKNKTFEYLAVFFGIMAVVLIIGLVFGMAKEIFESEPELPDHCHPNWR